MNRNNLEVLSNLLLSWPEEAFSICSNNEFKTPKELYETQELVTIIDPIEVFAHHFLFEGSWVALADDLFGDDDDAYWFVMSSTFENNTALDVSRRISYMLEHGVPKNYDETFVVAD